MNRKERKGKMEYVRKKTIKTNLTRYIFLSFFSSTIFQALQVQLLFFFLG